MGNFENTGSQALIIYAAVVRKIWASEWRRSIYRSPDVRWACIIRTRCGVL